MTPREKIGEILGQLGAPAAFSAQRKSTAEDLHLEVKGLGQVRFPISATAARQLCKIARPARYGRREATLLDRQVRDSWEIPKSRLKIDQRRWNRTLLPMLEALKADLGLADGLRLKAELHALLVYAPGQFFLPHQDSEKDNEMVGTLVVTLPSAFKGGALMIEHQGVTVVYRASKQPLSFVAFYADCRHEVRPVKQGYRVALTYNLVLQGKGGAAGVSAPATLDALAASLREHFEKPRPPTGSRDNSALRRASPSRLVVLLDHQYTERGLGWHRLKGNDAARAAALREVALREGYELVLALAEVQETWSCMEPGWDDQGFGRQRHWDQDEDENELEDEPSANGSEEYELEDLLDSSISLGHWLDLEGKKAPALVSRVSEDELCVSTPSSELEAYKSDYEGYMGNYGNTMDRWYRRAALVLWPREGDFLVRAESSPAWALDELKRILRAGKTSEARQMVGSLQPFWQHSVALGSSPGLLAKALRVAAGLEAHTSAMDLLRPFRVEELRPSHAAAWIALVKGYGEAWVRSLAAAWSSADRHWARSGKEGVELAWLGSMPRFCEALLRADANAGPVSGQVLCEDRWAWARKTIEGSLRTERPSLLRREVAALRAPLLGLLESAALTAAESLREEIVVFLCSEANEALLPGLVGVVRAAQKTVPPARRAAMALDPLRAHCASRLAARLALPPRVEGDWSIPRPRGCRCQLCSKLASFLADSSAERLAWPLAKEGRQHIHQRLDLCELPVRHETQRSGSPYTLVLTKKKELFQQAAQERESWRRDLDWLESLRGKR